MIKRWPFTHSPKGWYRVAYSADLKAGDVLPLKYFETDLVLFRTAGGQAVLLDAFCPHLGAHLGHGGKVEGESIRCPFHAWKFGCDGVCDEIPYANKIPPLAKIRKWSVIEKNGLIMAWNNIEGGGPEWEIPDVAEHNHPDWTDYERRTWKIATHGMEMAENSVDSAHFKYLHGTSNVPTSRAEVNGPMMRVVSDTGMVTPRGGVVGQVESMSWGFGFGIVRFTGLVETLLVSSVTPIDGEYMDIHFNFKIKKVGGADVTKGIGKAFIAEITRQLEQDRPIWENKKWVKPPILCEGDGPIGVFRKWTQQFFPAGTFEKLESRAHH